ncbi:MAG: class I SAM-dependent methyltransferase [Thermoanaerobaculia bacterium]
MSTGYVRALSLLHNAYKHLPAAKRVHILGRFLTTPFLRVLPELPAGRVLDMGAGDGVFARLATEDSNRVVIALEPSMDKSFSAIPRSRVQWIAGGPFAVRGTFAAVMMFDLLHHIPLDARDALLLAARERLAPGGTLLIKELDTAAGWKARWVKSEPESRDDLEARLRRLGFIDVSSRPIDSWYPQPHTLFVARKAAKPMIRPSRVIGPIL